MRFDKRATLSSSEKQALKARPYLYLYHNWILTFPVSDSSADIVVNYSIDVHLLRILEANSHY